MATEIKSFTIQDSGDPSVGMPATSYELTGGFVFDEPDHLTFFKEDLIKLLDNYGFIQGRGSVITDVEHASRLEAESENTDFDFAVPMQWKSGGKFKLTPIKK